MDRVLRQCIFRITASIDQFCENSSPVIGGDHGSEALLYAGIVLK
jgi:hypothetical protein